MRNGTYILCNCKMLDIAGNHTLYFESLDKQLEYFLNKKVFVIEETQFHRKESAINVNKYIDDLDFVNYVLTRNNSNGKTYFYFVYDKIYINDNNTKLILKLDVIQTYLFDIDLNKNLSLVDRTHVQRYRTNSELPYLDNIINSENLEVGEYIEKSRTTLYDYSQKGGYIVASSDKLTARNGGSSGGTNGGIANKMVDENGFVLIKCMESFSSTPYNIGDGTNSIGYGITEKYQNEYYKQLAPFCTEEQASEILLNVINNFSTQVYTQMVAYGKDMSKVTQNEFNAFVSLAYNTGVYGMTQSQIFIDYCNNVSRETIYNKWLTTLINEGTIFEEGLRDRRQREADVFKNNIYNFKEIENVEGGYITTNGGKGHIPSRLINDNTHLGDAICESARKLIGKPYVWGGNVSPLGSDVGTDCSGLCQWAYNDNGKRISRTTYTQITEGYEVSRYELKTGDLIFTNFSAPNVPEHVFIYSGIDSDNNMKCIEAPSEGLTIRERVFNWTETTRARRLI